MIISFIFPFWKRFWKVEATLFAILGVLFSLQLLIPMLFKDVVDSIANFESANVFASLLVLLGGFLLVRIGFSWCYNVLASWMGECLLIDVTSRIYHSVLSQQRSFWFKYSPNDVLTRLTQDAVSIKSIVVDLSHALVFQAVLLVGNTVILLHMSLDAGLLMTAYVPIVFAATYWGNQCLHKRATKVRALASSFTSAFQPSLQNQVLVFSWGLLGHFMSVYKDIAIQMKKEQVRFVNQTQMMSQILSFLNLLVGTVGVLWIVYYQYQLGSMTVGTLIAVITYSGQSAQSAIGLANLVLSSKINRVSVLRVHELLQSRQSILRGLDPLHEVIRHPFFRGSMKDGVKLPSGTSFIYHLSAGNGAGKTTLSQILSGFDDLGGTVIRDSWFLLPSDPLVFSGSLIENIRVISGRAISESDVSAILKGQGFGALLSLFPSGFSTMIGNSSDSISRGQKQAVVLISAIVKDPPQVIIDEGLNSLDNIIKLQIKASLIRWLSKRKSIVIEHENYIFASAKTYEGSWEICH